MSCTTLTSKVTLTTLLLLQLTLACAGDEDSTHIGRQQYEGAPEIGVSVSRTLCANNDSTCAIADIRIGTLTDAGGVIVSDGRSVFAFDQDNSMRELVRKGNGPGEVQIPLALRGGSKGRVHLFDVRRMHYLVLSNSAPTIDVAAMPPMTFTGARFGGDRMHVMSIPAAALVGDTITGMVLRRGTSDTGWVDTVARFPARAVFQLGGEGAMMVPMPWDSRVLWDICGDGSIVLASNDRWFVQRLADRGAALWMLERPEVIGTTITDSDKDSVRTSRARAGEGLPGIDQALERALQSAPSHFPIVDAVNCSDDNRVFVRNIPTGGDSLARWDILAEHGSLLGKLILNASTRILDVRGRNILALEVLASGAERIVVLQEK